MWSEVRIKYNGDGSMDVYTLIGANWYVDHRPSIHGVHGKLAQIIGGDPVDDNWPQQTPT